MVVCVVGCFGGPLQHNGALCDIATCYGPAWAVVRSVAPTLSLLETKERKNGRCP